MGLLGIFEYFIFLSGDTFEINPSSGSIEPEKFIELKLTLTASTEPSVYEGEMECSITWD